MRTTDPRQVRGLALFRSKGSCIRHVIAGKFLVPSATRAVDYVVDIDERRCTCPDYEENCVRCKHMWAVAYLREESDLPDESDVVTESVQTKRRTYGQSSWADYNRAQCEELETARVLLRNLVEGVEDAPRAKTGRPPIARRDALFAAAIKVYGTLSARRSDTAVREAKADGFIEDAPSFNSVLRTIREPGLESILRTLVEESARPLATVESLFSPDGTGFATQSYVRWFDHKHGKDGRVQTWVKLHVVVGTHTNIITAARVTTGHVNDSVMLPSLINATTAAGFKIAELSADKAYLSHDHLALIEAHGARPFIPFKGNSRSTGSPAWERMHGWYTANAPDFLAHYHRRSNVEATFSALKRKFGENVRAKTLSAQVNEILLKCVCFNVSRLVHSIHVLGIDPKFWTPRELDS